MRSTRNLLLIVVLAGAVITVPVFAQQPSDYPAPCEASKVTKADVDRAHTVFLSGKQFLEEANYDKAISYFKDAYSIDCSVHAILPIIATAYERKGDKTEAVHALEEYARRAPNAPDHEVLARRIKNLKDQFARDQQAATASASAAPPIGPTVAPPPVVASGGMATTATPPSPSPPSPSAPPEQTGGHSALPWVVVGLGGAAVATGVVFYALGASEISSALNDCHFNPVTGKNVCTSQPKVDQGNRGNDHQNVGEWVLGGGLAVVAAGLVWHFLERTHNDAGAAAPTGVQIGPAIAPGYAGVAIRSVL